MATATYTAYCDNSTLANFIAWAQPVCDAFSTFGWVQSGDSGQVDWGTIVAVPGSDAYVYQIWSPGDSLTACYVKVEFGNKGASAPAIRVSIGTGTNGSGTLTGSFFGPIPCANAAYTAPGVAGGLFNCYLSGDEARFAVMMWRDAPANTCSQFFAVERSRDSVGAYTATYATLVTVGIQATGSNSSVTSSQRTLHFSVGAAPGTLAGNTTSNGGLLCRGLLPDVGSSDSAFNSTVGFDPCTPYVGIWDYPMTAVGVVRGTAVSEGVTFTVTLYGETRTYLPSKNNREFGNCFRGNTSTAGGVMALCMRYD